MQLIYFIKVSALKKTYGYWEQFNCAVCRRSQAKCTLIAWILSMSTAEFDTLIDHICNRCSDLPQPWRNNEFENSLTLQDKSNRKMCFAWILSTSDTCTELERLIDQIWAGRDLPPIQSGCSSAAVFTRNVDHFLGWSLPRKDFLRRILSWILRQQSF